MSHLDDVLGERGRVFKAWRDVYPRQLHATAELLELQAERAAELPDAVSFGSQTIDLEQRRTRARRLAELEELLAGLDAEIQMLEAMDALHGADAPSTGLAVAFRQLARASSVWPSFAES